MWWMLLKACDTCVNHLYLPDDPRYMHREWTEIAGELHRRGLFWTVADIIAELVPTGRAAVDAHKALYDYLGPQYVFSSPDAILVHLLTLRMALQI